MVTLSVMAVAGVFWLELTIQDHTNIQREVALQSKLIRTNIAAHLEARIDALRRMAHRWATQGQTPRDVWFADAINYVNDFGDFQAIEWVDPSFHVRWIVPLVGNEQAQDLDLAAEPRRRAALEQARILRDITMTHPIDLVQGGKGILVYCPIHRDELFEGFVLGVFRIEQLLANINQEVVVNQYDAQLIIGQDLVYEHCQNKVGVPDHWFHLETVSLYGVPWTLRLAPSNQLMAQLRSPMPTMMLVIGGILGVLLGVMVRQAQKLHVRALAMSTANEQLESQIHHREQIEAALRDSECKASAVLDTALDPIITINDHGIINSINPAGERVFGYSAREVIGKNVKMLMPSPYHEQHDGYLERYRRTGERRIIGTGREVVGQRKDGATFPMHLSVGQFQIEGRSYFAGIAQDITARKHAEDLLRVSEERFNLAVQGTSDGLWDWDIVTNHAWYAPRFKELLGVSDDEFPSEFDSFESCLHPDERESVQTEIKKYFNQKIEQYDIDCRLRTKGCQYRWFRVRGVAVWDENGTPVRMAGSIQDVHQQKLAEQELGKFAGHLWQIKEELRVSQQRFELAVQGTSDGLWDWDIRSNEVWYAPRFKELLEYSDEEFPHVFESFESNLHPADRDSTLEAIHEHLNENKSYDVEYRMKTKRNGYRWFRARGMAVRDEHGMPLRMAGSIQDITDRRQAEQSMRVSELRKGAILESALDCIITVDQSGKIVEFNPAAERTFGYRSNEVIGEDLAEMIIPPSLRRPHRDGLARYLATGKSNLFGKRVELMAMRSDGSQFPIELAIVDIRMDGHRPLVTGFLRDITERKQKEEELRAFTDQLQRSNRELEEFARVASHDLQEPLRKVRAFGDRVKTKYANLLPEDGRQYIERMQGATARMQGLINDLLMYSRVTTKSNPFEPVDLNQIVQQVITDLELRIEETRGRVDLGSLPSIEADPIQMRQLFQNLIGNGLKYHRPQQPPEIRINATVNQDKGSCQITVADNGIGFDPKYVDRIFAVFQRLHGRSEYEGTGVGLAICRKIVERHGGSISADGRPGKGSTFLIDLPVQHLQEAHRWAA